MATNQVWELVDLTDDHKPVGNKWVLNIKYKKDGSDKKYKVPLVVKDYNRRKCIDYEGTSSLVVGFASIRLLLAMVAHRFRVIQTGVNITFLNEEIYEKIYIKQPIALKSKEMSTKCAV